MTMTDLQTRLAALGFYHGQIDGLYGPASRTALLTCLQAGPDTPIQPADIANAAAALSTDAAHIRTVRDVEAAGAGFANGLPKILFEGHIFSKLTRARFDRTHPAISYPKWDSSKYPGSQQGRYDQLLEAVGLDVDAAFSSASYGAFQILGENFRVCGFTSSFEFVLAQCQTEGAQLIAFINFIRGNRLDDALRNSRWAEFARGYNGTAYKVNQYDTKLAQMFAKEQAVDQAQPSPKPSPQPVPPPASIPPITIPATGLVGTYKITAKLNLRAAPGGEVLGVVEAGGFINVVRDLGDWVEVNYAPGKNGYLLKQYLAKA